MSKKKYKEGELGRFVSEQHALANKATTWAIEEAHPFTQVFDLLRRGNAPAAQVIVKKFTEDEVKACAGIVTNLHALLALKDLIENEQGE